MLPLSSSLSSPIDAIRSASSNGVVEDGTLGFFKMTMAEETTRQKTPYCRGIANETTVVRLTRRCGGVVEEGT